MREVFKQILKDIKERPNDFRITEYTLHDIKTDVQYWVCNGLFFYSVYHPSIEFTLLEKIMFAYAARHLIKCHRKLKKDLIKQAEYEALQNFNKNRK